MHPTEFFALITAILTVFIGMPWVILHYVTKWRQAPRITQEDEKMLDEMFHLARRLEERVRTVERLVALDNPDYRSPTSVGTRATPTPVGYDMNRRS